MRGLMVVLLAVVAGWLEAGAASAVGDFGPVVAGSDVALTFANDSLHPWTVEDTVAILRGNGQSGYYAASWLTMTYSSDYRTELSFEWASFEGGYHEGLQLYIDDTLRASRYNAPTFERRRFLLEPGSHVVAFRDSTSFYNRTANWSAVRSIRVRSLLPVEAVALSPLSQPLVLQNDGQWPWTVEEGCVQNSNFDTRYSASSLRTSFTIDRTSKLAFQRRVFPYRTYWNGSAYVPAQQLLTIVNGRQLLADSDVPQFANYRLALEPGTYTVEWRDTIGSAPTDLYAQLRQVELSDNWVDVELLQAGTLGTEVLYQVDRLGDIELLKVRGRLGEADWRTLRQMTSLLAVDLSEAVLDTLPSSAFATLGSLQSVALPQGLTAIASQAFTGTMLRSIAIPPTVTTIAANAFSGLSLLHRVTIAPSSALQYIGAGAFQGCTALEFFLMPHSVTELGERAFQDCFSLQMLQLSDGLAELPAEVCWGCTSLTDLHLPQRLIALGRQSFGYCGMDSVCLPATLEQLGDGAFAYCANLRTIVCPLSTPPVVGADPFEGGVTKDEVTLRVPAFAVVSYKLDDYWYQFGHIEEGADVGYWKIMASLALTNNRRMPGKPDVDLMTTGSLTVGGSHPQPLGQLNIFAGGQLLSYCDSIEADSVNYLMPVEPYTWYFIAPSFDTRLDKLVMTGDAAYVVRYYDGEERAQSGVGASWKDVNDSCLHAGRGYIFQANKGGTLILPASPSSHRQLLGATDVVLPLVAHEAVTTADRGWNYLGNPYPAHFDIYYMDFAAPITVREGNTYRAYSVLDDDFALQPAQPFFVQKPVGVDSIVMHKEGRQLSAVIDRSTYARRPQPVGQRQLFDVQITDGTQTDQTRLVVTPSAIPGYELGRDASKFMSYDGGVPQVLTLDDEGTAYAINERPADNGTVRLAYYAAAEGVLTLSTSRADGELWLTDHHTGTVVCLSETDYEFLTEATTGGICTDRFTLSLNRPAQTMGISEAMAADGHAGQLYDLHGRKVSSGQPRQHGIYVVKGRKIVR